MENDYAGLSPEAGQVNTDFPGRRAAAYQAYYEHQPLRARAIPEDGNMRLYRRVTWATWPSSACSTGASTAPTSLRGRRVSALQGLFGPRGDHAGLRAGALASREPGPLPCALERDRQFRRIKFFDGDRRGYVRCQLDRSQWRTDLRMVPTVTVSDAPVSTFASFVVADGQPGAQPV